MTRTIIFGEESGKLESQNFDGAKLTAIFGGLVLDFTNCILINSRTILDVTAVCGGISLTLPKEWNIKTDVAHVIMGGIDDNANDFTLADIDQTKELIIKGEVVMGGIEIKRV